MDLTGAALREVCEETGLRPSTMAVLGRGVFDVDIHSIPARGDEPEHEHFDVRFLFKTTATDLRTNGEVKGARWVPLNDVEELESDEEVRMPRSAPRSSLARKCEAPASRAASLRSGVSF